MLPNQRWQIAEENPEAALRLSQRFGVSPLVAQVMLNRGLTSMEAAERFLTPDSWILPDPVAEFPDLEKAILRLTDAIREGTRIAICGDYDCDGMTSTALLLRAVRGLGGQIDYAIPSRMNEGYGINRRIVEEFYDQGIGLVLTVDNGISAYAPIARAVELGMAVIITDHHDLPEQLPPADAILNPKLLEPGSPYAYLAGVGVAYVLADCLAAHLGRSADLADCLLELYTLGTVADLAPLVGVNRAWVSRGLSRLARSSNPGIRALIAVSGLADRPDMKPEAIGFGLGPRINAVGRIADPQIVIELLTTDDDRKAAELAAECEECNQLRQQLCRDIEQEAIELVAAELTLGLDLKEARVIVVGKEGWHHGVIGIVASRLKERYGAPVFIYAVEQDKARGSARGIPEFHIYEALKSCGELFSGFGGHPMAGGFSLEAVHLEAMGVRLREFARARLESTHIAPLIEVDAQASFAQVDAGLLEQVDRLQPCGLGNGEPVFWTRNVQVVTQKAMGKTGTHLNLTLDDGTAERRGVVWRMAEWMPLPEYIDVAYHAKANEWQGVRRTELEVIGIRPAAPAAIELPIPEGWNGLVEWRDCREGNPLTSLLRFVESQFAPVLLYGHGRPQLSADAPVHYDRPHDRIAYGHLLLWSLPPSPLHLHWLVSTIRPHTVHLFGQPVPLPHPWLLERSLRQTYRPAQPLPLLRLAQQWWVSPRVLLDCLVELGLLADWPSLVDREVHDLIGVQMKELPTWYASSAEILSARLQPRPSGHTQLATGT